MGNGQPDNMLSAVDSGTVPCPFGKFELLRKIGSGGMAEIYKARMSGPGGFEKIVVIKKILPSLDANEDFIEMFVAEAKLTATLQHANIVQIFELGDVEGQHYIAMEYVDGRDLLQVLRRSRELDRFIPPELAVYIISEICKGLHHAHNACDARGNPLHIIHRDVSPSNVLISHDGEVKIMDFGVARARRASGRQTRTGVLKGKMGYMSPEQVVGDPFDHRVDIFSLGILLFESLTSKRLFLADTELKTLIRIRDVQVEDRFQSHAPWLPPRLRPILRRALARLPEERFATALEMHDALMEELFDVGLRADARRLGAFMRELFAGQPQLYPDPSDPVEEFPGPPTHPDEAMSPGSGGEFKSPITVLGGKRPLILAPSVRQEALPEVLAVADAPPVPIEELPAAQELEDAEFALRDTDGGVFGPVRWPNFLRMLRNRSVGEDEQVSINGGEWRPLRDLTRLREIAPEDFPRGVTDVTHRGRSRQITFPRIVFDLFRGRKTGILSVWRECTSKEVFFKRGQPRHITSSIKDELFGAMLIERGVLTREDIEGALEHAQHMGARLGDALISQQHLHPGEVSRLLSHQLTEKFLELFSWEAGFFAFHEGAQPPTEVAPIELDTPQLIVKGVRSWMGPDVLAEHFETRLDAPLQVLNASPISTGEMGFSTRERRYLTYLQEAGSLRDVLARQGRNSESRLTLLRLAYLLEEMGVISVGEGGSD